MGDSILAVVIILGYCFAMWVVGAIAGKQQQKSVEDYFLASRSMGWLVLSTGMLATWGSAWAYLGNVGMYYTHGLAYLIQIPFNLLFIFLYWSFGSRLWRLGKQFNYITPGDLFEDFYESRPVSLLTTLVLVVFAIPFMTIQMMSSGYMFEVATGGAVPFWAGALVLCGTIAFYSWSGGKRAAMWTNVAQCVLMIGGMVFAGSVIVRQYGGVSYMFSEVAKQIPEMMTSPGPLKAWDYRMWISYTVATTLGSLCGPHMLVNMFVAKNIKTFKTSLPILAFPAFFAVPILLMGIGGRLVFPGLQGTQADNLLPLLLVKYFPLWLAALVMAGGLAAAMSTVDQIVIATAASITRNVYPQSFKSATADRQVSVGKTWVLIITGVAWLFAITKPSLISVLGIWVTGCWMQLTPALYGILYWHRASKWGAFWGTLTGVVLSVVFTAAPPPFRNPLGFSAGLWGLLGNIIVFYAVSVMTKPPSAETLERFTKTILSETEA